MTEEIEYNQDIYEELIHQFDSLTSRKVSFRNSNAAPKIFAKAARLCEELRCDPATYALAQLTYEPILKGQLAFLVTQVCTHRASDNVHKFRAMSQGNTRQGLFDVQKEYLAKGLKAGFTLEQVLLSTTYDLDPWFRCLISTKPIPSVMKKWGAKAREQLESDELKAFIQNKIVVDQVPFDLERLAKYYD